MYVVPETDGAHQDIEEESWDRSRLQQPVPLCVTPGAGFGHSGLACYLFEGSRIPGTSMFVAGLTLGAWGLGHDH